MQKILSDYNKGIKYPSYSESNVDVINPNQELQISKTTKITNLQLYDMLSGYYPEKCLLAISLPTKVKLKDTCPSCYAVKNYYQNLGIILIMNDNHELETIIPRKYTQLSDVDYAVAMQQYQKELKDEHKEPYAYQLKSLSNQLKYSSLNT